MQQLQTDLDPGVGEESIFCTQTLLRDFIFFFNTVSLAVSIVGAFKKVVSGDWGGFFSFGLLIFGSEYCVRKKNVHKLLDFFFLLLLFCQVGHLANTYRFLRVC